MFTVRYKNTELNMFCKVNYVFISIALFCCCLPLLSVFSRSALQTIICLTVYMLIWSWHPTAWLPCLCWLAMCSVLMTGHSSRISWNQMPVRNVSSMGMASSEATYFSRMQVCSFVPLRSNKASFKKGLYLSAEEGKSWKLRARKAFTAQERCLAPGVWLY